MTTTQQLANSIGFELSEIKDNSIGKLSFRQSSRLQRWGTIWGVYSLVLLVLGTGMIQNAIEAMTIGEDLGLFYLVSTWSIPLLTLLVGAGYGYVALRLSLFRPDIRTVDGSIAGEARRLTVDGRRIGLGLVTENRRLNQALDAHGRAYYLDILPFMRPLLSIDVS